MISVCYTYARQVGEDGFTLLDWLDDRGAPPALAVLPQVKVLRTVWQRHYARQDETPPGTGGSLESQRSALMRR